MKIYHISSKSYGIPMKRHSKIIEYHDNCSRISLKSSVSTILFEDPLHRLDRLLWCYRTSRSVYRTVADGTPTAGPARPDTNRDAARNSGGLCCGNR